MKIESAIVITVTICIFLAFYFALLSFQTVEDANKKQLTTLAVFSLITGIILFASLVAHLAIKKTLSRVTGQLTQSKEPPEHNEN